MANENPTKIAGSLRRVFQQGAAFVDGAAGTLAGTADPGDIAVRTDAGNIGLYQNTNTKASPTWGQIAAGGVTLDGAYDYGGAGAGKAVTVDSGAIALTNNAANNNGVLTLEKSPVGAQSGNLLTLTMGAQASGAALALANSGSGNDITGTAGWHIQADGDATFLAVTLAQATLPAGTSVYIGRDNAGDATINALVGKTVNLAVAGTDVVTIAGALVSVLQHTSITGNLTISGSLSFGGALTVGDTLTVDELILDTDGVAPAGTNAYVVRDNGGDLTLNAVTGKIIAFAIAGSDEVTLSAATMTFASIDLATVGYVELAETTLPAGTSCYIGRDNTGDTTVNALTGKMVHIAVNAVDTLDIAAGALVVNEGSGDVDFRVETNGMAYAIYSDGGKDSIVLGSNTDTSNADRLITVSRAARTGTAATNYFDLEIAPAGAISTSGVVALLATVWLGEPNITVVGGSVTVAATLVINSQPTEGDTNSGLLMADSVDIGIGNSTDCILRWATGDADNHALALGLGASLAFHIAEKADVATDWNVAAATNPTLYVHGAANPATEYVAISTDETDAHLNAVGANWKIEIGGTLELALSATIVNLSDNSLRGSAAAHTPDTADGSLYLGSTSHATKGFVCIANADLGLIVGSDGSVDRATIVGTNALHLFNGTAPSGTLVNGISLYSEGGECKVLDAAGNSTTLSPHTEDGDYIIHSYSVVKDQTITIHLEKLINALAGTPELKKFVQVAQGHALKAESVI